MARICKVLIVENDDDVRDLLGDIFEDDGFRFSINRAGTTGVATSWNRRPISTVPELPEGRNYRRDCPSILRAGANRAGTTSQAVLDIGQGLLERSRARLD